MKKFTEYICEEQFLENFISENNIYIEEGKILKAISKLFKKIFNIKPKDNTNKKEKPYYGSYGYFNNINSKYNLSVKNDVANVNELTPSDITSKEKYKLMSFDDVYPLMRIINKCTIDNTRDDENDEEENNEKTTIQGFPRFKEYIKRNSLKGADRIYCSFHIEKNSNVLPCVAVMIVDRIDEENKKIYNIADVEFIVGIDKDLEKKLEVLEKNVIEKLLISLKNNEKAGENGITATYDKNVNYDNNSFVKSLKNNGFSEDGNILLKTYK